MIGVIPVHDNFWVQQLNITDTYSKKKIVVTLKSSKTDLLNGSTTYKWDVHVITHKGNLSIHAVYLLLQFQNM